MIEDLKKRLENMGWVVERVDLQRDVSKMDRCSVIVRPRAGVEPSPEAQARRMEESLPMWYSDTKFFVSVRPCADHAYPTPRTTTPAQMAARIRKWLDGRRHASADFELHVSGSGTSTLAVFLKMRRRVAYGIRTLRNDLDLELRGVLDRSTALHLNVEYDPHVCCTECGESNPGKLRMNHQRGQRGAMECYACVPPKAHERLRGLCAKLLGREPTPGEDVDAQLAIIVNAAEQRLFPSAIDGADGGTKTAVYSDIKLNGKRVQLDAIDRPTRKQNIATDIARGIFRTKLRDELERGFEVRMHELSCRGCAESARASGSGCTEHAKYVSDRMQRVEHALAKAWDEERYTALRADAEEQAKAIVEEMHRAERFSMPIFMVQLEPETITSKQVSDHIAALDKAMSDAVLLPREVTIGRLAAGEAVTLNDEGRVLPKVNAPILHFRSLLEAHDAYIRGDIDAKTVRDVAEAFQNGERTVRAFGIVKGIGA